MTTDHDFKETISREYTLFPSKEVKLIHESVDGFEMFYVIDGKGNRTNIGAKTVLKTLGLIILDIINETKEKTKNSSK